EENPPEQSRLGIFFSKEIFKGGVIRIHNDFVQDEDRTYGKVACIGHKLKGTAPMAKSLASHISSKGKYQLGAIKIGASMSYRSGNFGKILYEPSVETGMTEKTPNTLDGSGMR
nr:hypothetical protein [Tanacetum cinerariifolium]